MSPLHKSAVLEISIGWCDDTTNAVTGCDKVSPGCKNCYAQRGTRARVLRALGIETWGPKGVRHPVAEFAVKLRRLNKLCICDRCHQTYPFDAFTNRVKPTAVDHDCTLRRIRLFADSNSDWLDLKWPIETLAAFLDEIRLAPNVDVLLLTKRIENWRDRICEVMALADRPWMRSEVAQRSELGIWLGGWIEAASPHRGMARVPANLWLGVSAEDQTRADERIIQLLQTPAHRRFVSCEPLLEDIDLDLCDRNHKGELHWIIVGGESGDGRRDPGVAPIYSIVSQCRAAGIPVYVKQDAAFKSGQQGRIPNDIWNLKEFPK